MTEPRHGLERDDSRSDPVDRARSSTVHRRPRTPAWPRLDPPRHLAAPLLQRDRKSTRLNSSHDQISYAVFCLKKKKKSLLRPSPDHSRTLQPPCRTPPTSPSPPTSPTLLRCPSRVRHTTTCCAHLSLLTAEH